MKTSNALAVGMVHRPDIDGMRAVAVLTVVAYHVGIHAIPGGFVGVDVFFVISGFLITQVLLQDIHGDRFSLPRFYERRVRRIFPALIFVLAATFVVCSKYSLPAEFVDLSKSQIAAALSASNIYFWISGDYFTAPALTRPLLHTWSLAVEEQFYIFWPLYLSLGLRYFRRRLLAATFVAIAISFLVSAVGAFTHPSWAFYMVHTRAWELLLGSILPLGALGRPLGPIARNLLSAAGLLLIVASVLIIHTNMPFPGVLAVPPCLGAFLIILGGRDGDSFTSRLLGWKPVAFIGLISYSVYLWHWPLTVFQLNYSALTVGGSDRSQKLVIVAYSLVLGALSWRLVEQPFRSGWLRPTARQLFWIMGTGIFVVVALGFVGWASRGFPERYSARDLQIAAVMDLDNVAMFRTGQCFLLNHGPRSFAADCLSLDANRPNYLILGDSHAAELWIGLRTAFPDIHFLQATAVDCFPVVEHAIGEASKCTGEMDGVLKGFLESHKVDMVLLAARWKPDYLSRIGATLDWLRSRSIPVTLVGPTPVYNSPLPRLVVTANRTKDPGLISRSWNHSLEELDQQLEALASLHFAAYISPLKILCKGYECSTQDAEGLPLLSDEEHFTSDGSIAFAMRLRAQGFPAPNDLSMTR